MKVVLSEVNKFFKSKHYTIDDIVKTLNRIGFEVERFWSTKHIDGLVLGHVISVSKHPTDELLNVCNVTINEKFIQVLTRAKIKKDVFVIVALPNTILPNGKKIESTFIKGEKSEGMMVSLEEVGMDPKFLSKYDQDNLITFTHSEVANFTSKDPNDILNLADSFVEISLLQGRAYANNYYWLTKELAAFDNKPLYDWVVAQSNERNVSKSDFIVKNNAMEFTTYFGANSYEIRNNGRLSWQQKVLANKLEIVPNCVLADLAAYVTHLFGVPISLFDRDRFVTESVSLESNKQETVTTLSGHRYDVWEDDLVIANGGEIIEIAGIVQSAKAPVDSTTTRALMVIGNYDKVSITKTFSRYVGLNSDSARRYRRGLNFSNAYINLMFRFFSTLLYRNSILVNLSEQVIVGKAQEPRRMVFNFEMLYSYFGITKREERNIAKEKLLPLLNEIGIGTLRQGGIDETNVHILVDPFRTDIETQACIIEEYSRLINISAIKGQAPIGENKVTNFSPLRLENKFKDKLWMYGFVETKTYQLVSEADNEKFNIFSYGLPVKLSRVYNRVRNTMRQSLVNSLLDVYVYNANLNNPNLRFFETAKIFNGSNFTKHTAFVIDKNFVTNNILGEKISGNFYTLKMLVNLMLSSFGLSGFKFSKLATSEIFNVNEALEVYYNKELICVFGTIHPRILIDKKIRDKDLYYAEFKQNPAVFDAQASMNSSFKPVSSFPNIKRAFNVVIKESASASKKELGPYIESIKKSNIGINHVSIKDVFKRKGETVYTLECWFTQDKTYSKEELATLINKVEDIISKG